jgi:hypothetical protein
MADNNRHGTGRQRGQCRERSKKKSAFGVYFHPCSYFCWPRRYAQEGGYDVYRTCTLLINA